ncbi:hypothetical protein B0H13DRAFT_1867468 [Mycena leptocephala]|nr:hypothetical protein B0H13DRAFT_1867468 [Mycena leptocephala]
MRPLSFLAVLLLSVPTNAASVVQPAPNAGTVFAVYPGWDMDNGALQTILNGTELACLQSCSSSATCVAYAYIPYGNNGTISPICVLKSTVDLNTFKLQPSFDLSVGIVGACGTYTNCRKVRTQTIRTQSGNPFSCHCLMSMLPHMIETSHSARRTIMSETIKVLNSRTDFGHRSGSKKESAPSVSNALQDGSVAAKIVGDNIPGVSPGHTSNSGMLQTSMPREWNRRIWGEREAVDTVATKSSARGFRGSFLA